MLFFDEVGLDQADALVYIPVEVNGKPSAIAIPREWVDSVYIETVSSGRSVTRFLLEWEGGE